MRKPTLRHPARSLERSLLVGLKIGLVLITASLCFAVQTAHAQATTDTEFWSELAGQAKFSKGWRGSLAVGLRLENAGRDYKSTYGDVGVRYKFVDAFSLKAAYRYAYTDQSTHRLAADALAQVELGKSKVHLGFRGRLQALFEPNKNTEVSLRNRAKVDRSFDWGAPFAYFEIAYRTDKGEFRRYRIGGGVEWSLGKNTGLSTSYIFRREINQNNPQTDHIFNVGLTHGFKGLF